MKRDAMESLKHLKGDSFTLRCDVVIVEDVKAKATSGSAASPFVAVPPPDMQRHFTDLLMSKEGTDVTFEVGGETFAAHRCVLAARSRVFRAELFSPMKEGSTSTADAIHVEDMDARVFRIMLAFIYSDSEPKMEKDDDEDVVSLWQHLLVAADRYDLQRLKLMCEDKLCGFIDVNTMTSILSLAERHNCDGLKKACYDFLGSPGKLKAIVATNGFVQLAGSCPSVIKELVAMLAP
jgi:speckle-type POZ protein